MHTDSYINGNDYQSALQPTPPLPPPALPITVPAGLPIARPPCCRPPSQTTKPPGWPRQRITREGKGKRYPMQWWTRVQWSASSSNPKPSSPSTSISIQSVRPRRPSRPSTLNPHQPHPTNTHQPYHTHLHQSSSTIAIPTTIPPATPPTSRPPSSPLPYSLRPITPNHYPHPLPHHHHYHPSYNHHHRAMAIPPTIPSRTRLPLLPPPPRLSRSNSPLSSTRTPTLPPPSHHMPYCPSTNQRQSQATQPRPRPLS
jgi:hypothetical protein